MIDIDRTTRNLEAWAPIVDDGRVVCWRCHLPIAAGQTWQLGERPGRYAIPQHTGCAPGAPSVIFSEGRPA
jgi:hypothetical protein